MAGFDLKRERDVESLSFRLDAFWSRTDGSLKFPVNNNREEEGRMMMVFFLIKFPTSRNFGQEERNELSSHDARYELRWMWWIVERVANGYYWNLNTFYVKQTIFKFNIRNRRPRSNCSLRLLTNCHRPNCRRPSLNHQTNCQLHAV